MLRRLPYYFLFVASLALVAACSYVLVMSLRANHGFTPAQYLDLLKIAVGLIGVAVAVHVSRRNRIPNGGRTLRATVINGADNWIAAFTRRPLLAALVAALLLAIPLTLLVLARGGTLGSWTSGDWTMLALGETPAILIGIVGGFRMLNRSPNNRWRGP